MTAGSGRCHGPGCTQTAVVEFWCGERCQFNWDQLYAVPRETAGLPIEVVGASQTRPLQIAILGDSAERFSGPSPEFREAIRRFGASMGEIGAAGAAIAACGVGQAVTHSVEVERLTMHLRMACPPERFNAALAEVDDLMHRTWMPRHEALQRVLSEGRFATSSAEFPQVASKDPQVGWFRRWLDRLAGRHP